jgi:DNA-binding transcriptional MerR regulator
VTSTLRSGELAAAAGVNQQTLRYYERRGLLAEPRRSPGGHRLYPAEAVTTLRAIKTAQRLGFTLDEIRQLRLRSQASAKLVEVEARIAELQEVATTLRAVMAAGCDDLVQCASSPACPLPFPGDRP